MEKNERGDNDKLLNPGCLALFLNLSVTGEYFVWPSALFGHLGSGLG